MSKIEKNPDFHAMGHNLIKNTVRYAKRKGLNFFEDSFRKQGFTDVAFESWENRKDNIDPGRAVLIKTRFLLDSLDVEDNGGTKITYFNTADYADIHNNGGTLNIKITEKARKYFWFMFMKTGEGKYRAMALTKKKAFTVVIPKRQFLGHSETLLQELDEWFLNYILIQFKRH